MGNKFTRNTMKITAIYNGFKDGTLVVDRTYQRKTVWGVKDNIRLIETILLKLIIPEIFLWDFDTDPNNGATITHIVDGQQRINAIFDFIAGKYKFFDNSHTLIRMLLYIIAPKPYNSPSFKQQSLINFIIPFLVPGYLTNPKFTVITFLQSWF